MEGNGPSVEGFCGVMGDYYLGCADVVLDDLGSDESDGSASSTEFASNISSSSDNTDSKREHDYDEGEGSLPRRRTRTADTTDGKTFPATSAEMPYAFVEISASDSESTVSSELSMYGSWDLEKVQMDAFVFPTAAPSAHPQPAVSAHTPQQQRVSAPKIGHGDVDLVPQQLSETPLSRRTQGPASASADGARAHPDGAQVCDAPLSTRETLPRMQAFRRSMRPTMEMRTLRERHMSETHTDSTDEINTNRAGSAISSGGETTHKPSSDPSAPQESPPSLEYSHTSVSTNSPPSLSWSMMGDVSKEPPPRPPTPCSSNRRSHRLTKTGADADRLEGVPSPGSQFGRISVDSVSKLFIWMGNAIVTAGPLSSTGRAGVSTPPDVVQQKASDADLWEAAGIWPVPSTPLTESQPVPQGGPPVQVLPAHRTSTERDAQPRAPSPRDTSVAADFCFPRNAPANRSPQRPPSATLSLTPYTIMPDPPPEPNMATSSARRSPSPAASNGVRDQTNRAVCPAGRPRSSTAPDVFSVVAHLPSHARYSAASVETHKPSHTSDAGAESRSRPCTEGRRSSGIRFLKARKAPDPFAATTTESGPTGKRASFSVVQRSPLASLLLTPTTRSSSNSSRAGYAGEGGDMKTSRMSFKDRITTQEDIKTVRAMQGGDVGSVRVSARASSWRNSSSGDTETYYSVGTLLSADGGSAGAVSDGPWNAVVASPAPLAFLGRRGSEESIHRGNSSGRSESARDGQGGRPQKPLSSEEERERNKTPCKATATTAVPRRAMTPSAEAAVEGDGNESAAWELASEPEVVPRLMLPGRVAPGPTAPPTLSPRVTADQRWTTTVTEDGAVRVVYAGDCILPQVLRDHQTRSRNAPTLFTCTASNAPSTSVTSGDSVSVAIVGIPPSPLRRREPVPTPVRHWSPVAHSSRHRRPSPRQLRHATADLSAANNNSANTTNSTDTTVSTKGGADVVAPVIAALPPHIEHIFSFSASLAQTPGTQERGPSRTTAPELSSAPASSEDHMTYTDKSSTCATSSPTSSPSKAADTQLRWERVPLPALTLPTKTNYVLRRKSGITET